MTITVTTVANNQSFGAWLSTTNRLANIISQNTVTVDTSTGGSLSTGNGYVNGYFGANYVYVANGLSGGNISSNGVLYIISNAAFTNTSSNLVSLSSNSTQSDLVITVSNVNITANNIDLNANSIDISANSIVITGNTTFTNAVIFSNTMSVTNPSTFTSNLTIDGAILTVGNSSVNAVVNSTAFIIANSTVTYPFISPSAAQYAANTFFLNANGQWAQVGSYGSNTQVQFNDSGSFAGSTGFTFNKTTNTLSVGTTTINSTVVNATSYIIDTSVIANTSGVYTTGTVNAASLTTSGVTTNTSGVYTTGTVNAASHTVGTSTTANATGVYTTGTVNAASLTTSGVTTNTSGVYTTGVVNGSTISVGTSVIANTTRLTIGTAVGLQANGGIGTAGQLLTSNGTTIYWSTPAASVAGSNTQIQFNNSGTLAGDAGLTYNITTDTLSTNAILVTTSINAASYTVGTSTTANTTGVFTTGTVNGATISVGTSVVANTSRLALGTAVGLQANGSIGTTGQVLTSNGTTVYWGSTSTGTVTSVATGNGVSGGPITSTGTISILANNGIIANTTGLFVFGNTGLAVNSTGVHVNSTYIGTLTANSATFLGAAGNFGNASGIYTSGTVNAASLTTSGVTVNTSGVYTTGTVNGATITVGTSTIANSTGVYTGVVNGSSITVGTSTIANSTGVYTGVVNGSTLSVGTSIVANTSRLVIGTAVGLQANGDIGTSGQVLTSNGTTVYWGSAGSSGTVSQVNTGNGMTGGPITTTGTVSVLANNGIIANSTGLFVFGNTGLVANATGLHINNSYIATLAANSATYLGAAGNLGNSSGIYTSGTINAASFTVGTDTVANSTGVYTGVVNGSTLSVGSSITANSTRLVIGTAVGIQANGSIGTSGQVLTSNGTTVYWGSAGSSGTVSQVNTGNGLTGGPITTTGSIAILANSGIIANSTGTFVFANTGLVANATGVHVNSSYIATQIGTNTANNASYAYGKNEGNLNVNTATYTQYLGAYPASTTNFGNSSGIYSSGTINAVSHTTGNTTTGTGGLIANTTTLFIGNNTVNATLNATGLSLGSSLVANTSRLIIGTAVGLQANGNIGSNNNILVSNGTTAYWTSNLNPNNITVGNTINTVSLSVGDSGTFVTTNSSGLYFTLNTLANTIGFYTNNTVKAETLKVGTIAGSNVVLSVNSTNYSVRETVRAKAFYASANADSFNSSDISGIGYTAQLYNGIVYINSNTSLSGGSPLTTISLTNVNNARALEVTTSSNTTGSHAIIGASSISGGGSGKIGVPLADGGYSFYSVAGTIGPFTASHDAMLLKNVPFEIGDVVTDKTVLIKKISDTITSVELAVNQCNNPIGVLISKIPTSETHIPAAFINSDGSTNPIWNQIKDDYDYVIINSVGEGCINVVGEGGEIFAGDLLVASSTPGKAMKQSDDIIRNKTIAKARERIKLNPGETAQIACIYLCG